MTTGSSSLSHPIYRLLASMHDTMYHLNTYYASHQEELSGDVYDEKSAYRVVKMLHPIFTSLESDLSALEQQLETGVDEEKLSRIPRKSGVDSKYDPLIHSIKVSILSYSSEPSAQLLHAVLKAIQVAKEVFQSDLTSLHGWLYHSYLSRLTCLSATDIDYMQETLGELQQIFNEHPHANMIVEYDWLYLEKQLQEKKMEFNALPRNRHPLLVTPRHARKQPQVI